MSDSSLERNPVEELAAEFIERRRRGEWPALSEYTNRYPELADKIRSLFPLLIDMEAARPATQDNQGPGGGVRFTGDLQLERLGDFRVLREVGRGGMGIVYEGVQLSLGRHVALKVLPQHALLVTPATYCASSVKRRQRPGCTTPILCRSTASAKRTACTTLSCISSKALASMKCSPSCVGCGGLSRPRETTGRSATPRRLRASSISKYRATWRRWCSRPPHVCRTSATRRQPSWPRICGGSSNIGRCGHGGSAWWKSCGVGAAAIRPSPG